MLRISLLLCVVTFPLALSGASECPDGWTASPASGTCVKVYNQLKTWGDARSACQAENGDLVKILDQDMNTFVSGLLNTAGDRRHWIGLHDRVKENRFVWLDDDAKVTYTNWARGQPNNYKGQDCIEIGTYKPKWQDDFCSRKSRFICEQPKKSVERSNTDCPAGWTASPASDTCIKVYQQLKTWTAARAVCQGENGDLVRILNTDMNSFVSGLLNTAGDQRYWIGLHDRVKENRFVWLDDDAVVTYTNWARGQPNNYKGGKIGQDCVEIGTYKPKWQDDFCTRNSRFICEQPKKSAQIKLPECPEDWAESPVSDTCVKAFQQVKSWTEARAVCQAEKGDLVKIPDEDMNNFVAGLLNTSGNRRYWIGLHDRVNENRFVWLDEDTMVSYTNWAKDQPNNLKGNKGGKVGQDCTEIGSNKPKWQDDWCVRRSRFMCERPKRSFLTAGIQCPAGWSASPASGTCVKVYQDLKSWPGARAVCKAQGGDLTKILNDNMNTFVNNLINSSSDRTGKFWIGLHDRVNESKFVWLDEDTQATYTNWGTNQPNNYGYQKRTGKGGQDCVEISTLRPKWQDAGCGQASKFVCERPSEKSGPPDAPPSSGKTTVKVSTSVSTTPTTTSETSTVPKRATTALPSVKTTGAVSTSTSTDSPRLMTTETVSNPGSTAPPSGRVTTTVSNVASTDRLDIITADTISPSVEPSEQVSNPDTTATPSVWTLSPASGTMVRVYQEEKSWPDARAACQAEGGDLVKILDENMNTFVAGEIQRTGGGRHWIGLHDLEQESIFVWLDEDTEVTYTNWAKDQPNNFKNKRTKTKGQDCVEIGTYAPKWQDDVCSRKSKFVCERAVSQPTRPSRPVSFSCPDGWSASAASGTCVRLYQDEKSWSDARAVCQVKGGDLVKILDENMNTFVADLIQRNGGGRHWIGLHDLVKENRFVWLDSDTEVTYTNWAKNQPNNFKNKRTKTKGQDCVEIGTYAPKWQDDLCSRKSKFVCERAVSQPTRPTRPVSFNCPDGWSASAASGSCVRVYQDEKSWSNARAVCKVEGGDLVKILGGNMNTFVAALISRNGGGRHWIGLHDLAEEDRFVWLDEDTEVTYTNWAKNQPNNFKNKRTKTKGQDCVEIGTYDSKWQDDVCSRKSKFVCERAVSQPTRPSRPAIIKCKDGWSASPASGTCVKVYQAGKTWTGARAVCQAGGGDLVKILDNQMNTFVAGLVSRSGSKQTWIGLHDTKGDNSYLWLDDSVEADYLNWAVQQPNSVIEESINSQNCAALGTLTPRWQTSRCTEPSGFVCEHLAIAQASAQKGGDSGSHTSLIVGVILCVAVVGSIVIFIIIYRRNQAKKFSMSGNTTTVSFTNLVNDDIYDESNSDV